MSAPTLCTLEEFSSLSAAEPWVQSHCHLLENRVRKNARHLRKRMARQAIDSYRLYDWDIPEVRARVDRYGENLVVSEYERAQTQGVENYLAHLGAAAAAGAGVHPQNVHLKSRRTKPGVRYERQGQSGERFSVQEGDLKFWVNLKDYLDTGLFFDHRKTRAWLQSEAEGKSCLNLYAYTGAFSCSFAEGRARRVVTVDQSATYLRWAQDNFDLNRLTREPHAFVHTDVRNYLEEAKERFDIIFVDPPSFSTVGGFAEPESAFRITQDYRPLLEKCWQRLNPGGRLIFSTNHAQFEPNFPLEFTQAQEITHGTMPEDCRVGRGHRAFAFQKSAT